MKRQLTCLHNKAENPEMGVVCDLREPNSLCKNCKTFQPKFYVIQHDFIFGSGYVKLTLGTDDEFVELDTEDSIGFATKFKRKWMADLMCWLMNKLEKDNDPLSKTFKVVEISK